MKKNINYTIRKWKLWLSLFALLLVLCGCSREKLTENTDTGITTEAPESDADAAEISAGGDKNTTEAAEVPEGNTFDLAQVPDYGEEPSVIVNQNQPWFSDEELVTTAFEDYSELDALGRCGVAYANICKEIMPTEERGAIGQVKPSGWHTVKYNDLIDGNYLYNRCHLIGYQLAGENANEKNLITGTRYLNTEGMLPYENQVAEYVKATGNHVLYRVTPIFEGDNLVASGVLMEAKSVEDKGTGVCFCVYVYNCQPGIHIDYATGESQRVEGYTGIGTKQEAKAIQEAGAVQETEAKQETEPAQETESTYVLNTNTHKFHRPDCYTIKTMAEHNKQTVTKSRETIISEGYEPCKKCNP